ncbi:MBL fold metallo-hydrolase [Nonomuraea purpurea]|uniref:MBL fold metallo-hydrolase n=1 Tax=Nonomuraea purpurea TaxID=1849276 RepID=A0ABV8G6H6_9ACTN
MRVHHLNCGSLRTITPIEGSSSPERAVCHCLLIETDTDELVLVETGFGLTDIERPRESLEADFLAFAEPVLDPEETAIRQVARLGFAPANVRHIVLTHLHRDHTGGLPDFPHATVHVHEAEYRAVTDPDAEHHRDSLDRFMEAHRAHGPRWAPSQGRVPWFGMEAARLEGLPDDILLIPLPGHTPGHSGVAVRLGDRWLLHAGDAYFYHGEITADPPTSHPEFDFVQESVQVDRDVRLDSLRRLRALHREHGDEVEIFSSHDPWEFQRYA